MTIPSSPYQLAFYLALLVPGVVFAAARVRLRGPRAADRSVSARVLEAIVASAVFDGTYALIFSEQVSTAIQDPRAFVVANVATCSFAFLALGVVVPYLSAWAVYGKVPWLQWAGALWDRIRPRVTETKEDADTPTAWDFAAKSTKAGWVRLRLSEGVWVGGVWDERGRFATYPESRDVYIAEQWRLDESGKFVSPVEATQGVWVSVRDEVVVEWLIDKEDLDG